MIRKTEKLIAKENAPLLDQFAALLDKSPALLGRFAALPDQSPALLGQFAAAGPVSQRCPAS